MFKALFDKYATDEYHNVAGRVMTEEGFEAAIRDILKTNELLLCVEAIGEGE